MDGGPGLLSFTLDRVFNVNSTQEEVYEFSARPVIESNHQISLFINF